MYGRFFGAALRMSLVLTLLVGCTTPPTATPTAAPPTPRPAVTAPPATPVPQAATGIVIDGVVGEGEWDDYAANMVDSADGLETADIEEVHYFANSCFLYVLVRMNNPALFDYASLRIHYSGRVGKVQVNRNSGSLLFPDLEAAPEDSQPIKIAFAARDVLEIQVPRDQIGAAVDDISSVAVYLDEAISDEAAPNEREPLEQISGGVVAGACPSAVTVNATTSGLIPGDEIWRGEVILTGDITVMEGVTLTIEPGTRVLITPNSDDQHCCGQDASDPNWNKEETISIEADPGILIAEGTAEAPIVFEPLDEPGGLLSLVMQRERRASWEGLNIGRGSRLRHAGIRGANIGVQASGCIAQSNTECLERTGNAQDAAVSVDNVKVENPRTYGIAARGTGVDIRRNEISGAGKAGIAVSGGADVRVTNNVVRGAAAGIIAFNNTGPVVLRNNIIVDSAFGIDAGNNTEIEISNNTIAIVDGVADAWYSGDELISEKSYVVGMVVAPYLTTRIVNNLVVGPFDSAISLTAFPQTFIQVCCNMYFETGVLYEGEARFILATPAPEMGASDTVADPLFIGGADGADFHLSEGSPAIDAGAPDLLDPDGSPSDLGAYGGPDAAGWDD
ncbi:MAG: right-handed parallel beta-helix repeat-containing protein [Anaerolineae bacterium]|nr:MAG: right-handed parallel beta-helix repeat-containing protein [Anaerolineae bacterium]